LIEPDLEEWRKQRALFLQRSKERKKEAKAGLMLYEMNRMRW
jgi:hypothetical protein